MRTNLDYNDVVGVPEDEFHSSERCAVERVSDPDQFTKTDQEEIAKIERLLDVVEGTLSGQDYYLSRIECECGRLLTNYDFVLTGLVDAGHSKSLILHTFVGSKYVENPPRPVRCSQCARIHGDQRNPAFY
jgi:hypothetical protein